MKLKEIMRDLITQAKAAPGQAQRRQLGKGLQVIVKVAAQPPSGSPQQNNTVGGRVITVGCCRSGVYPSQQEMEIVLRDAGAPRQARDCVTWDKGEKAGYNYLYVAWKVAEQGELWSDEDWEKAGDELMAAEAESFERGMKDANEA